MNVLPRLEFLNAITVFTPLTVFLIKSFKTNKISLHGTSSGFETESQYITGLEREMPVTSLYFSNLG
jgi:hypothetical protein